MLVAELILDRHKVADKFHNLGLNFRPTTPGEMGPMTVAVARTIQGIVAFLDEVDNSPGDDLTGKLLAYWQASDEYKSILSVLDNKWGER